MSKRNPVTVPDEKQIGQIMASDSEVQRIKKTTVESHPETGLSMQAPSMTYADIVAGKDMTTKYVCTVEDIKRFKQKNPFVTFANNTLLEQNHLHVEDAGIILPEPSLLFL